MGQSLMCIHGKGKEQHRHKDEGYFFCLRSRKKEPVELHAAAEEQDALKVFPCVWDMLGTWGIRELEASTRHV